MDVVLFRFGDRSEGERSLGRSMPPTMDACSRGVPRHPLNGRRASVRGVHKQNSS